MWAVDNVERVVGALPSMPPGATSSSTTSTTRPEIDPVIADALESIGFPGEEDAARITALRRGGSYFDLTLEQVIADEDPLMIEILQAACPDVLAVGG